MPCFVLNQFKFLLLHSTQHQPVNSILNSTTSSGVTSAFPASLY